jgi:hypothetical protein
VFQRYMQIENLGSAIIRDCGGLDSPSKAIGNEEGSLDSSFGAANCRQAVDQVHGNNSLIVPHCRELLSFWKRFTAQSKAISFLKDLLSDGMRPM